MRGKTLSILLTVISVLTLLSTAFARVEFSLVDFNAADFRNMDKVDELCSLPASTSFWCELRDADLQLITTKSNDFLFDAAGQLVAVYAKQQKGQDLNGNYNIDANQNLIPYTANIPGLAVLIDGQYLQPTEASSTWTRVNDTDYRGEFSYRLGDYQVEKLLTLSGVRINFDLSLKLSRVVAAEDAGDVNVQLAMPGIARQEAPTVKIGQGENFTLNPLSQPVDNPSYISIQNNNRNTGFAMILRPAADVSAEAMQALFLPPNIISMQKSLSVQADSVEFDLRVYTGRNELVTYYQEGYRDLAGLFNANILGRLSVGVILVLEAIQGVVGSWGLSIIILTLLFRVIIWPLMTTQTKSMVGMQQIQPKLQELQKKYKDNREKLTQETMKLYQEAGVNPAGGCLPILIQMPIFIILWRVFLNYEFNQGFLWIPDLGLADPTYILPILYVGVMVGQSFLMAKGNPQSLRQQLLINVVFVFFIINFPAGVTLYWVASMLVQIAQQYLIQRRYPSPAKAA